MVIINPASGKEEAKGYMEELKAVLEIRYQMVDIKETSKEVDAEQIAKQAAEDQYDTIIAVGGDGTVFGAVNGILKSTASSPNLGIIPVGTVNNFARGVGIPTDPQKAIRLLATAAVKEVDAGKIEDTYFVSSVSAGPIPETVQHVDSDFKSHFGVLAYLVEGLKALDEQKTYPFRILFDGKERQQTYSLILIALNHSVVGIENFFPAATVDDGELFFLGLKETSVQEKLSIVPKLFQENTDYTDNVDIFSFKEANFMIENEERPKTTVDGETGLTLPAKISIVPQALQLLVNPS